MNCLNKILDIYIKGDENEATSKVVAELEIMEEEYSNEQNRAQEYLDSRRFECVFKSG